MVVFVDRVDAGRRLARELESFRGDDLVVLGLPRGGVPVAFEVAAALDAPLDVIVVRKLGVPFQPDLAMGAIGEGGVRVLNPDVLAAARITDADLAAVERRERAALEARLTRLRRGRPRIDLTDRVVIVVDDGIATGSTARVACQVARRLGAAQVIMAAPVAPRDVVRRLPEADQVICASLPADFLAVGAFYRDFTPTTDDEVVALLDAAADRLRHAAPGLSVADCVDTDVQIPIDGAALDGHLHLPDDLNGVVVFAHGSGSSRHSPRNRYVADVLSQAGLGTLLLDLLTPTEELDRAKVFDIGLLAERLEVATAWLRTREDTRNARIGYFGASTGAGAALSAAAELDSPVAAVVSRGGRPDLAGSRLAAVRAPTLLIVGGNDELVLSLNRQAQAQLSCPNRLEIVPGATHLFEEPGTLAEVAILARDWFAHYLAVPDRTPAASSQR
ncbi:putative phosphoribosyl transferase [Nakamurella panacisegetis]|uniref:Putative phosphoribosyl transferase n=1 Tax=Nakamurella panacisegetis TaxID=1090615 RepID=A0A1H0LT45_9ACTN|nr:phosphoribosyltransferase [Nakamurella panacisegetis]SDO71304.1 putative phosphoribosyl transferase [Nakamurella panacisegetis]